MSEVKTVKVEIEVPEENGVVSMNRATAAIMIKGLTIAAEVFHAAKDEIATEQTIEARDFLYGMYDHCWGDDGASQAEQEGYQLIGIDWVKEQKGE